MTFVAAAMFVRGVIWTNHFWEAPTWVGFIFLAYLTPQAIYIERTGTFEQLEGWIAWQYITLCLAAFYIGFYRAKKRWVSVGILQKQPVADKRLLRRATIILLLGAVSLLRVREMAAAEELGSQWTGAITFFYLLFQCIFMALAVGVMRWLDGYRTIWLILVIGALALAAIAIGANAKRSLTVEVFLVFGILIYMIKGWTPPRMLLISVMVFGTFLMHQIGAVREYVYSGQGNAFQAVAAGVPFQKFNYFEPKKAPELTQALVDIYRARQGVDFDGPVFLWNRMVHQYVPAFLVGQDIKDGLKIQTKREYLDGFDNYNWFGATRTGFSDTFSGYWFFGALMFALIGWIMGRLYMVALYQVPWALFLYPLLVNDAMFAITESTARFFSGGFFVLLISLFLFYRPKFGKASIARIPQISTTQNIPY